MIAGTDIENRGNAGVTIKNVDKSTLPEEVRNSVGDKPVIQLVFTVDGEQKAWNNECTGDGIDTLHTDRGRVE